MDRDLGSTPTLASVLFVEKSNGVYKASDTHVGPISTDNLYIKGSVYDRAGELLEQARDCINQLLDDLSKSTMYFPGVGVCRQAWDEAVEIVADINNFLDEFK